MNSLNDFQKYFATGIPRTPTNRYASIILLRETKSYAIFTTEGGEQQDVEQVRAGLKNSESLTRLVMFKRKQVAPERRTGKALLRQYGNFPFGVLTNDRKFDSVVYGAADIEKAKDKAKGKRILKEHTDCYLTEGLCAQCPDCLIYGYAALEGEGSRKARLMTDTCFTVRPYEVIQKQVKFNVIDEAKHTSGTITEYDYTTPGVFLPAVETTVDLTSDEFIYVLSNILRTNRYGKEGTRQGFVRNHVLAIGFSDVELFANLELSQAFYDAFVDAKLDLANSNLTLGAFQSNAEKVLNKLTSGLIGRCELIRGKDLAPILSEVKSLNQDETKLRAFLRNLNEQSASFIA